MAAVLAAISGLCALVVFALLIRNILNRRRLIAASPFPAYSRASINLSYLVTLTVLVPWTAATFLSGDPMTWLALMSAPFALTLLIAMPIAKLVHSRQSPETSEYARQLVKRSLFARFSPVLREMDDDGRKL